MSRGEQHAPISSLLCRLDILTPVPQMTTSHLPVSLLFQGRIDRTFPVLDNRMHGRDGRRVSPPSYLSIELISFSFCIDSKPYIFYRGRHASILLSGSFHMFSRKDFLLKQKVMGLQAYSIHSSIFTLPPLARQLV